MALPVITPLRKRVEGLYADFHKDLTVNPVTEDLARLLDEEAVNESLKNLLLTDRGERLFQPNLGSDIRATLFENNTPATITVLKQQITDTIKNYEPRITLIDVEVLSNYDDGKVGVKIYYYLRNRETELVTTVFLRRVR